MLLMIFRPGAGGPVVIEVYPLVRSRFDLRQLRQDNLDFKRVLECRLNFESVVSDELDFFTG